MALINIHRIGHNPGRGLGSCDRDKKTPINVTVAKASQRITPTARTQGVDPDFITMIPVMATTSETYPALRAQTAILQCEFPWSSGGAFINETPMTNQHRQSSGPIYDSTVF